ncbi:hypothetical protein QAD02_021838 [Eretmocerus hayati]|uniref:Uncharacterized protein n=1 Tax=Eretmocerus hayati TaxID=131215 RepID=A0ACC2PRL2_9HYME|nr:hypothetical protein QAD02_021838 [Eretmocerus hayati]
MSKLGTFGTDFELGIFIQIYNVSITVYQEDDSGLIYKIQSLDAPRKSDMPPLQLLFSGDENSGHWLVLLEKDTPVGRVFQTIKKQGGKSSNIEMIQINDVPKTCESATSNTELDSTMSVFNSSRNNHVLQADGEVSNTIEIPEFVNAGHDHYSTLTEMDKMIKLKSHHPIPEKTEVIASLSRIAPFYEKDAPKTNSVDQEKKIIGTSNFEWKLVDKEEIVKSPSFKYTDTGEPEAISKTLKHPINDYSTRLNEMHQDDEIVEPSTEYTDTGESKSIVEALENTVNDYSMWSDNLHQGKIRESSIVEGNTMPHRVLMIEFKADPFILGEPGDILDRSALECFANNDVKEYNDDVRVEQMQVTELTDHGCTTSVDEPVVSKIDAIDAVLRDSIQTEMITSHTGQTEHWDNDDRRERTSDDSASSNEDDENDSGDSVGKNKNFDNEFKGEAKNTKKLPRDSPAKVKCHRNLGEYIVNRADLRVMNPDQKSKDVWLWCPHLIKEAYETIMIGISLNTCFFSPWGSVRINKASIVAYARCGFANHDQAFRFKFECLHKEQMSLIISTNKKVRFDHKSK